MLQLNLAFYPIYPDHRHIDSMPVLWLPGLAAPQITRDPPFTLILGLRAQALIACPNLPDSGVLDTQ